MPDTIVLKFGGSSLKDELSQEAAVRHVRQTIEEGFQTAVVVSAMGRAGDPYATDTLINLLRSTGEPVSPRELDLIMSSGEIISAAFFAHLLTMRDLPSRAFTGQQAGLITDNNPGTAEIIDIHPEKIKEALDNGLVAIVAGFQGVDLKGEIHTLGRGGSDISAVVLGSALLAQRVEIFSDVKGVAICDPRQIPKVPFLKDINSTQLLAMAEEGSTILHPKAIKVSQEMKIPLRLRSTFSQDLGTFIFHEPRKERVKPVSLAHLEKQILIHFPPETRPAELVPELVDVGKNRFLLLDDVYSQQRVTRLLEAYQDLKYDYHWGTVSVLFSGETRDDPPDISRAEIIPSPPDRWRYLLRDKDITTTLQLLYKKYFT